jgi:hypothetical protein
MERTDTGQTAKRIWICVLDREMRMVYLGTDPAESQRACLDGSTMTSAPSMGDAMIRAAFAAAAAMRSRRSGLKEKVNE